jgi:diguanylate cyclase (GGDEF)-like protein
VRDATRLRVYELLRAMQDGVQIPPGVIEELVRGADRRAWPEVARAGLFLAAARSLSEPHSVYRAATTRLLDRAQADGDIVMGAVALAMRAQVVNTFGDPASTVAADRDLARASIMLETAAGSSLEHASAHNECARAFGERDLWELELEHYSAAEKAIDGEIGRELVLPTILYNKAEVELNWCAALREIGDERVLAHRSRLAREALERADVPALPDSWRQELRIFATLLSAIEPGHGPPDPVDPPAEGSYGGYVRLTRARSIDDHRDALVEAEEALARIDHGQSPQVHNLALCVAAEIEAAAAGRETAGLRYANQLARQRWAARLSSLASMQSLLHAERLSSEHALLSKHAYLDDLTRLGNRRALLRFVDGLVSEGVSAIALVLVDLDHFKAVNDSYGHSVGDETLIRVAAVLRGAVRAQDVAVRLGGDEFLLVLALPNPDAARRRADAIVAAIAGEDWDQIRHGLRVTASLGLAWGDPRQLEALRTAADAALYRAKTSGGNRISG